VLICERRRLEHPRRSSAVKRLGGQPRSTLPRSPGAGLWPWHFGGRHGALRSIRLTFGLARFVAGYSPKAKPSAPVQPRQQQQRRRLAPTRSIGFNIVLRPPLAIHTHGVLPQARSPRLGIQGSLARQLASIRSTFEPTQKAGNRKVSFELLGGHVRVRCAQQVILRGGYDSSLLLLLQAARDIRSGPWP